MSITTGRSACCGPFMAQETIANFSLLRIECSAKMNRGVNEAFSEAARVALSASAKGSKEKSGGSCVLM